MSKVRSDAPVGLFVCGDPINGAENQHSGELEWFSMMKFTKADAKPLMDAIQDTHQEALKSKPGWPTKVSELDHTPMKQDKVKGEDGNDTVNPDNVVFNFKRKGVFKNKRTKESIPNSPPRFFDSKGRPLEKNSTPSQARLRQPCEASVRALLLAEQWHGQWHQLPPLGNADR